MATSLPDFVLDVLRSDEKNLLKNFILLRKKLDFFLSINLQNDLAEMN